MMQQAQQAQQAMAFAQAMSMHPMMDFAQQQAGTTGVAPSIYPLMGTEQGGGAGAAEAAPATGGATPKRRQN
jgi:hypothetical protein